MAEKDKKREKESTKKKSDRRESNINSDLHFRFPDEEKIWCKDCAFRAKDNGNVKGATLSICDCFPRYDKPLDILFKNAECEYYVDENTK